MNEEYLARARAKVDDVRLLINGASRRASELAKGAHALVKVPANMDYLDIALLEIAEDKVKIVPIADKKEKK